MKKTLVAVAALAASAAFAQSSVTLYGVADAYFGSEKNVAAPGSQTVVNDGGLSQSRIGVSVKEDLGAGLSAFAVIEGAVALDSGAGGAGGLGANRKSVVGLSGDFGAVSLGRQNTPLENAIENTIDAQGNSAFSAVYAAVGGTAAAAGVTVNTYGNSVRYDSPNFDGFSGSVQLGFGENKTATTSADRGVSLNLTYANGPVAVAFAHQSDKFGGTTDRTTTVGGSYDFGPAKLNLGYGRTTDVIGTNDGRALSVGVTVPVGAFTVIGQYANAKVSNIAGSSKSFGLEGRYALSKRTTVYAGYNDTKQNIGGGANFKTNRLGVGIRHVF